MTQREWLTDEEEQLWRDWLRAHERIEAAVQDDLRQGGISESEYAILVQLTDCPDGLTVNEIGERINWDRNRVVRQVSRMVVRGWVVRAAKSTRGRGHVIRLTPTGLRTIRNAAPSHLNTVREVFFDRLDADDRLALAKALAKLT